jgi:solute carrier family 35 protein C2
MSWKEYLSVSVPCGLVTSGDVGLSNLSLVRISISFYTMVKASTPIFVLFWAYLFRIEKITWVLILVVLVIAVGEFLTVMGEVHYDLLGLLLCLSASFLSGARWTLVQMKLVNLVPPISHTIGVMRVLSSSMFFSMLILSLAIEKPWQTLANGYFDNFTEGLHTFGLGLCGAAFAIAMILCEFHLIMRASAIVLMIGGVIKEMITIIVGVQFFQDELNRINVAGCLTVFLGVFLYKVQFHSAHKPHEKEDGSGYLPKDDVHYKHIAGTEEQETVWIGDSSFRESFHDEVVESDTEKAVEMKPRQNGQHSPRETDQGTGFSIN